jgi:hypothetical protein
MGVLAVVEVEALISVAPLGWPPSSTATRSSFAFSFRVSRVDADEAALVNEARGALSLTGEAATLANDNLLDSADIWAVAISRICAAGETKPVAEMSVESKRDQICYRSQATGPWKNASRKSEIKKEG